MPAERDLRLVQQHTDVRDGLRASLLRLVEQILRSLSPSGFYGDDARAAARELAGYVATAQRATADVTWAYLDAALAEAGERVPTARLEFPARPRGVDAEQVWERPFKEYRLARSVGEEHDVALDKATARAARIAVDDLDLGVREAAAQHSEKAPTVIGQRRVIHPELSKGGTCGLCIAASDQIYRPGTLLPIHDGCNCGVAEVTATVDPGSGLNDLSLKDLYKAAGSTAGADLKRTRYQVTEHGELGLVLSPKKTKPRDAADVERDTGQRMEPSERARRRAIALERSIAGLEARQASGEDVEAQLKYQRGLLERERARAAA